MDIDLASLLVLRHLAETGSFTETGKRWNMSQPSVSLMISKLESAVGLVLLERSPGGTRLTSAGVAFLERGNDVCDSYLAFIDGMHSLGRRMDRQVLVGMDLSWFSGVVKEELQNLSSGSGALPLACEISESWAEDLEAQRYDVVVAQRFLRAGLTPGIQEAVVRRERGITVAWNQNFYPFDPVNFSFPEVLRTSVLFPGKRVICGFSSFLLRWCAEAYGIQPANVIEFASEKEAAIAARAGLGVLLAPGDAMPRLAGLADDMTHVRTFEFLLPEALTFGIYCRSDEDSREILSTAAAIAKLGSRLFT
ncbi:MAG: LysR family transcriptional regulator [Akkermansiaceae bacterium]|nr:LysR family transcriptional regulator [Akkermansiaceae bacterium]